MKNQDPIKIKQAFIDILKGMPSVKYVSGIPITSKQISSDMLPAIEVFWGAEKVTAGAINGWLKVLASVFLRIFFSDPLAQDTGMAAKILCKEIVQHILNGNVRLPDQDGKPTCVSCEPIIIDSPMISANRRGRVIIPIEFVILYYYRTS